MPLEVRALSQIARRFGVLERQLDTTLRRRAATTLADALKTAQDYPPERPEQRYRRSENLKQRWRSAPRQLQVRRGAVLARARNTAAYSGYVQDADDQADVHVGRWQTTAQIALVAERDAQRRLDADVAADVRRIL